MLSFVTIFLMIYYPAYHIPFHSDDYAYFLKGNSWSVHITSYMSWSGRFITDYISTILLNLFSKPLYMAINSFVFTLIMALVSIIPNIITKQKIISLGTSVILWLVFITYWIANPNLGQTSFWLVGSANYLWPLLWASLFYTFIALLLTRQNYFNKINIIVLAVLGFFAGLSNEALAVSVVVVNIILLCFYSYKNKIVLIGFVSSLIGALILLLAPGNFARARHYTFDIWNQKSLCKKIATHVLDRLPHAFENLWIVYLAVLLCILIGLFIHKKTEKCHLFGFFSIILSLLSFAVFFISPAFPPRTIHTALFFCFLSFVFLSIIFGILIVLFIHKKTEKCHLFCFFMIILSLLSLAVFSVSPAFPPRAQNTALFYLILALAFLGEAIMSNKSSIKQFLSMSALMLLLLIYFVPSYLYFSHAVVNTHTQAQIREEIIEQAKIEGKNIAKIPDWYFTKLLKPTRDKFDMYRSESMTSYYGIKEIKWLPIRFNYAILKTTKPIFDKNINLIQDLNLSKIYSNDIDKYFDEHMIVIEFDKNPLNYKQEDDDIMFINILKKGKDKFLNYNIKINEFSQVGNKYYYVVKGIKGSKIEKIDFGFYSSKTKRNSAQSSINLR